MLTRILMAGAVALTGSAVTAQDDRDALLSDVHREVVPEAQSAQPSFETMRHYEGLKHLLRGRLLERQERLSEAMQAYDMALQFDPSAVELIRLCIPINFKLERTVP